VKKKNPHMPANLLQWVSLSRIITLGDAQVIASVHQQRRDVSQQSIITTLLISQLIALSNKQSVAEAVTVKVSTKPYPDPWRAMGRWTTQEAE
jgi:hypothetical protein